MRIVDAQIHLFPPDAQEYAAAIGQVILPPETILAAMDEAGVERAYLVPAGIAANPVCLDAARRWPDRFRVMGIVRVDKPESRDVMQHFADTGFIGVRQPFPPFRRTSWLRDGTADWFWPEADRLKLPVMVWPPEQLGDLDPIIARYRNIRFIIDHMALYVEDKDAKVASVADELVKLARHPNVAVKASSLPSHSTDPYPYRNLHPSIAKVVNAFGADRVMWGTDFTRRSCTYEQAVTMFTEHLDFLSAGELEQIMAGTITRWIGW
jgi:L-fuconolactonase